MFSHSFAWPAYIQHVLSDSGDRGTGGNSGGQKAVTTESASASASAGAGNSGRGNAIARVEAEEQALIDKVRTHLCRRAVNAYSVNMKQGEEILLS